MFRGSTIYDMEKGFKPYKGVSSNKAESEMTIAEKRFKPYKGVSSNVSSTRVEEEDLGFKPYKGVSSNFSCNYFYFIIYLFQTL